MRKINEIRNIISLVIIVVLFGFGMYFFLESRFKTVSDFTYKADAIKMTVPSVALLIATMSFLYSNYQSTKTRKTQTQLNFFNTWLSLKKDIDDLLDTDVNEKEIYKFRRYYSLLHMEYILSDQIDMSVYDSWNRYRSVEFSNTNLYAGKTYSQWWEIVKKDIDDESFISMMDTLNRKSTLTACADVSP